METFDCLGCTARHFLAHLLASSNGRTTDWFGGRSNGIPEFKGQILTVPDEENSCKSCRLACCLYSSGWEIEVERAWPVLMVSRSRMILAHSCKMRYRIFLISLLMLQGSFHTAAVYGENAAGCSMSFTGSSLSRVRLSKRI